MSKVRICFLGTPEFAVTSLKALISDEHYEIVGVITQPDRPAGRKMMLTPSPVKSLALAKGLKVISPEKVKQDLILQEIQRWDAEIAVVVAFGQILPQKFIDLFPFGAVNVHGSILPRWRGAAPIQRAIEAGDQETGVALQKLVKELDAGDVIGVRKLAISENMGAQELHDKLADLGADLLRVEMMDYIRGNLAPVPQDSNFVTYAKKIDKTEGLIKWSEPAKQIAQRVRAFEMGPGTWTLWQGKKLKIHRVQISDSKASVNLKVTPGSVVDISENNLAVATGTGVLELIEVQPESRNRMAIKDFQKGYGLKKGDCFG